MLFLCFASLSHSNLSLSLSPRCCLLCCLSSFCVVLFSLVYVVVVIFCDLRLWSMGAEVEMEIFRGFFMLRFRFHQMSTKQEIVFQMLTLIDYLSTFNDDFKNIIRLVFFLWAHHIIGPFGSSSIICRWSRRGSIRVAFHHMCRG